MGSMKSDNAAPQKQLLIAISPKPVSGVDGASLRHDRNAPSGQGNFSVKDNPKHMRASKGIVLRVISSFFTLSNYSDLYNNSYQSLSWVKSNSLRSALALGKAGVKFQGEFFAGGMAVQIYSADHTIRNVLKQTRWAQKQIKKNGRAIRRMSDTLGKIIRKPAPPRSWRRW